jgi:1-aminocyclopropane-1-carboxylate deaminase/D-cysteine desulfhydrase-like pyridoxal-dependent ACC family enzyme
MADTSAPGSRALIDAFPQLADAVSWLPLGSYPTRIDRFEIPFADGTPRPILVKREDLSGQVYGGNKVRKLEFILAEAKAQGARRLITAGAAGSHHALATAIYGSAIGFEVSLVLFPQRLTQHVREILLMDHAFGAELRWVPRMETVPLGTAAARLAHRRDRPYTIKPGGSDVIGTLGYVSAGLELAAQLQAGEAQRPSAIHVAAGTLGTAAGLAIGLALAGERIPIRAVRITSPIVANERALKRLVEGVASRLRAGGVAAADAAAALRLVDFRHDRIGDGYGRATAAGDAATAAFGEIGLRLDPTYTAKAAADLLDTPPAAAPPLFLHTLSANEPLDRLHGITASDLPAPFARYLDG